MPKPSFSVVRFHRQHDVPANNQPKGELHHNKGTQSLGFFRGTMEIGDTVQVYTENGKKEWRGWVTESVTDGYSGPPNNEGPAYFFVVQNTKWLPDPIEDGDTITVTVTDPTMAPPSGTSGPQAASPQPNDVP